jgi:hypothetical protein
MKTLAIFLIICCALFVLPSAMPQAARQTPTPRALAQISATPVSYTHLTLPTKA